MDAVGGIRRACSEEQSKLNLLQALTLTASQNGTSYRSLYIVSTRSKSNIEMEEKEWASCSSGPRNKPTLSFASLTNGILYLRLSLCVEG